MKKFILILSILAYLSGCKPEESVLTDEILQGKWIDNGANKYDLGGIEYNFEFSGSEFKLYVGEYTDLWLANCNFLNHWENYMKGTFILKNDSIYLNGNYCDSLYQIKTETTCESVMPLGSYSDTLVLKLINNETLSFPNKIAKTTVLLKQ